jgi:hypothetical protein
VGNAVATGASPEQIHDSLSLSALPLCWRERSGNDGNPQI